MLKGFTHPRTLVGDSSLVPAPPWHYVGKVLAVAYEAAPDVIATYLPEGMTLDSAQCCVYFIDWQYASDKGCEYLEPSVSQYQETILLISARYNDIAMAYCPFIWVSQDNALMRGLVQGWPKQLGVTTMTKAFTFDTIASPAGHFGMSLSVRGERYLQGSIKLQQRTETMPMPSFAGAALVRYFPNLVKDCHDIPLIHDLVRLKSRNVQVSTIQSGLATLDFCGQSTHALADFKPCGDATGYYFEIALTVDDLEVLCPL